jgi:hypothetical protein
MRRKRERQAWESEAFINRVFKLSVDDPRRYKEIQAQLARMHTASSKEGSVPFHKERLGDQDYTWVGEFRFWVWETPDWRVYANNHKGTCFEVRADLSDEAALAAWADYLEKIDLESVRFSPEQEEFFRRLSQLSSEVRF